jgi:uncharacterized membrane protein YkoI
MKQKYNFLAFTVISVAAIATVYAATSSENDALAIASAKVSLTQAVTTAEQHVGGKAARAEYEHHKGQWMFDVEVVKGKQVMDVKVDSINGKILSAEMDSTDHDDTHDKED